MESLNSRIKANGTPLKQEDISSITFEVKKKDIEKFWIDTIKYIQKKSNRIKKAIKESAKRGWYSVAIKIPIFVERNVADAIYEEHSHLCAHSGWDLKIDFSLIDLLYKEIGDFGYRVVDHYKGYDYPYLIIMW